MNESLVSDVFALGGSIVGGAITYLVSWNNELVIGLKKQVRLLSKQVVAYWYLEKWYAEEISKHTQTPK